MDSHTPWHKTKGDIIEKAHPKIMHVLIFTSLQNDDLFTRIQNLRGISFSQTTYLYAAANQNRAKDTRWRQTLKQVAIYLSTAPLSIT